MSPKLEDYEFVKLHSSNIGIGESAVSTGERKYEMQLEVVFSRL